MYALPLADELFLIGHDQYSGRPQVSESSLDTGLAGAVLGELVLTGRLTVDDGTIVSVLDQRPYGERVSDAALAEILKQTEPHPVRAWVEYLRDHARSMVAPRLINSGLVDQVHARQLLRQVVRYPAADALKASSAQARLRYLLDHSSTTDEQSATLGGLVLVTGLAFVIGGGSNREVRVGLARLNAGLRPDLRHLISGVESAVAQLALNARR